jgi:hypothetical protein
LKFFAVEAVAFFISRAPDTTDNVAEWPATARTILFTRDLRCFGAGLKSTSSSMALVGD